jgi:hypothetical protein
MTKLLGMVCGLAIMGGAVASWHYWHIDGVIAFLIAGAGIAVIYRTFEV